MISKRLLLWRFFILGVSLIVAIQTPLWNAFDFRNESFWLQFYLAVLVFYLLDFILYFFLPYEDRGEWIHDKAKIRSHYFKGWFLVDLLSILGTVFLLYVEYTNAKITGFTHFMTLLPAIKILHTATDIRQWLEDQTINPSTLRLLNSLFWLALSAHWISCGWIKLGTLDPKLSTYDNYIKALYWCVTTLTTIGYGDITPSNSPQIIYTMIVQIIGAGMYGYMIGNLASLIANLDIAKAQFQEKLEKVTTFMKNHEIPQNLQKDILTYYKYLWTHRRGTDDADVLQDLPISLKEKVALFLNRDIISKVPLFQGASEGLIRQIVLKLKPQIYMPGDFIFRYGDIGNEMYFISRGSVDVVAADEKTVYATLHAGDFFGEMALLFSMPRTAGARAAEFTDIYSLNKADFYEVLDQYPDFKAEIEQKAEERKKELEKSDS